LYFKIKKKAKRAAELIMPTKRTQTSKRIEGKASCRVNANKELIFQNKGKENELRVSHC
jgi:hypothetical protein